MTSETGWKKRTTRQDWQEWAQMNANRPRLSREAYLQLEREFLGDKPDFRRLQIRVWVKKSEAKAYRDYMEGF